MKDYNNNWAIDRLILYICEGLSKRYKIHHKFVPHLEAIIEVIKNEE